MGQSIVGCIPFVVKTEPRHHFEEYFANGFFDCYNETEKNVYHLKEDLFIANYKDFVLEFTDLVEEKLRKNFDYGNGNYFVTYIEADDPLLNQTTAEGFKELFSRDNRNALIPFFEKQVGYMFSITAAMCGDIWLFYSDGGKSYLESYDLLRVTEKLLGKCMKNPLAKAVKFGLYG